MLECPDCEKPIRATPCPTCGWTLKPVSKPAEGYQYWAPPVYPDPPATPEEAKAAIAKIREMLAAKMTPHA